MVRTFLCQSHGNLKSKGDHMDADKLLDFKLGSIDFGGRIVILEEPIILELSKAEGGEYLMANDDFGILTMGNTFEEMVTDVNEQFRVLWDEFVRSDDGLTTSGQMLKDKMLDRFVMYGHVFGGDKKQTLSEPKPLIVIEEPEDIRIMGHKRN